jgi:hypothetical protein
MSASEKLRALMRVRSDYFDVGDSKDFALIFALPQIVALAEAAEELDAWLETNTESGSPNYLADALSELDEALG